MKIKLTLDEKYRSLVELVKCYGYNGPETKCKDCNCRSELEHLMSDWLDNSAGLADEQIKLNMNNISFEKLLAHIYFAEEIKFTKKEYYWRFKSDEIFPRTWISLYTDGGLHFTIDTDEADRLTESDLKESLEGTGLPFDAFERVEINE